MTAATLAPSRLHPGDLLRVGSIGLRTRRLRAVLCWYDVPGERLVNDLDLELIGPGGGVLARNVVATSQPLAAQAGAAAFARGGNDEGIVFLTALPEGVTSASSPKGGSSSM